MSNKTEITLHVPRPRHTPDNGSKNPILAYIHEEDEKSGITIEIVGKNDSRMIFIGHERLPMDIVTQEMEEYQIADFFVWPQP